MKKRVVIGISGKIGVGKSTLATSIIDKLIANGVTATRVAFADLLKQECAAIFNFPSRLAYSQKGKESEVDCTYTWPRKPGTVPVATKKTVREILQFWGTEFRRAQDPNYWVKAMREHLLLVDEQVVIIDDIRFPNELDFVYDAVGLSVRLHPYAGWKPGPFANHTSETALDDCSEEFNLLAFPEFGGLDQTADWVVDSLQKSVPFNLYGGIDVLHQQTA